MMHQQQQYNQQYYQQPYQKQQIDQYQQQYQQQQQQQQQKYYEANTLQPKRTQRQVQQPQQQQQQQQQVQQYQTQQHNRQRQKISVHRKIRSARKYRPKVGRWFLGEVLGKGGFSWVKKGYDKLDGRVVALKFTSRAKEVWSESSEKQVKREIEALRCIQHPNVIRLLAYNMQCKYPTSPTKYVPTCLMVLEYLEGGELFDILYYTQALREDIARTYFDQLMRGLRACHKAGVVHRDIKPQNLLLDSTYRLKIADFGLAKLFEKNQHKYMRTKFVGTKGYQAPEILVPTEMAYDEACDIFSCGVVLFVLLAGYPPFEAALPKCRWYQPLSQNNPRLFWKNHRGCGISPKAKDLITKMLWYQQTRRIKLNQIFQHPWLAGNDVKLLNSEELQKELTVLHRQTEAKRMEERSQNKNEREPIPDVVKRRLKILTSIRIDNRKRAQKGENVPISINSLKSSEKSYYIDDIIPDIGRLYECCLLDYNEDDLNSDERTTYLCTEYVKNNFYNSSGRELDCTNIIEHIVDNFKNTNKSVKKLANNFDSLYLRVEYCNSESELNPLIISSKAPKKLTDIETTMDVIDIFIEIRTTVITVFNGNVNEDDESCSMEVHVATHNIPQPLDIRIQILQLQDDDYNLGNRLVRFSRIGGDALQYAKVLRSIISGCSYVLTGDLNKTFSKEERHKARLSVLHSNKSSVY